MRIKQALAAVLVAVSAYATTQETIAGRRAAKAEKAKLIENVQESYQELGDFNLNNPKDVKSLIESFEEIEDHLKIIKHELRAAESYYFTGKHHLKAEKVQKKYFLKFKKP